MRIVILSIITLSLFAECSSSKKTKLDLASESFIKTVVEQEFNGETVETIYNHDKDFAILINKIERGIGYPVVINFVVVDLLKKKLLYVESVADGSVSWIDNDIVLIRRVPGARSKIDEENQKAERTELNVREL